MRVPFFNVGDEIELNEQSSIDERTKKHLRGRTFVVSKVEWTRCGCECGVARRFDENGACEGCGSICKQYVIIGSFEAASVFFKLAKAAGTLDLELIK